VEVKVETVEQAEVKVKVEKERESADEPKAEVEVEGRQTEWATWGGRKPAPV
jgi:hypothetical protein